MTQPAVTKAIRKVEADLCTPLLGHLLTARGRLAQHRLNLAGDESEGQMRLASMGAMPGALAQDF